MQWVDSLQYAQIKIIMITNGILKLVGHLQRITGNQFIILKKALGLLILHELYHLVTRWQIREVSLYSVIPANRYSVEHHALKNVLKRRKHFSFGVEIDTSKLCYL